MIKIVAILTLSTGLLYAIPNIDDPNVILVYGYGDIMAAMLTSIGLIVNGGLGTLFKSVLLIGFFIATIKTLAEPKGSFSVSMYKIIFFSSIVYAVFLNANNDKKYQYTVYDQIENTWQVVNNIPIGIGKILEFTTKVDVALGTILENNLQIIPQGFNNKAEMVMKQMNNNPYMQYNSWGFAFFPKVKLAMNNLNLAALFPNIGTNLTTYIEDCYLYESDNAMALKNELINTNDLLKTLKPNNSAGLLTRYLQPDKQRKITNCQGLYDRIEQAANNFQNIQVKAILNYLDIKKATVNDISAIANTFLQGNNNARDYLQQIAITNALNTSFQTVAGLNGVDANSASFGLATAKTQANNNFFISGQLAVEYLPMIKAIVHMIIVGVSIIIALLSIMYMNTNYLKMFVTLNIWILLWTPLIIIINFFTNYKIMSVLAKLSRDGLDLNSISAMQMVDQGMTNAIAYSGSLLWLVPILAYSLASGSTQGFVSFATSLGSSLSSGAMMGARQVTSMANSSTASIATKNTNGKTEIYSQDSKGLTSLSYNQQTSDGRSMSVVQNLYNDKLTDAKYDNSAYSLNYNNPDGTFSNVKLSDVVINAAKTNAENYQKSFIHSLLNSIGNTGSKGIVSTYAEAYGTNSNEAKALNHLESTAYSVGEQITQGVGKDLTYQEKHHVAAAVAATAGGSLDLSTKGIGKALDWVADKIGLEEAKGLANKLGVGVSVSANGKLDYQFSKDWNTTHGEKLTKNLTNASEQLDQYQKSYNQAFNILNGDTSTLAKSIASTRIDQRTENYNEAENFVKSQQIVNSINTNTLTQFLNQNFKGNIAGANQFLNDLSFDIRNGASSSASFDKIINSNDLTIDYNENSILKVNPNIPSYNTIKDNHEKNINTIKNNEVSSKVDNEASRPNNKTIGFDSQNNAKGSYLQKTLDVDKSSGMSDKNMEDQYKKLKEIKADKTPKEKFKQVIDKIIK